MLIVQVLHYKHNIRYFILVCSSTTVVKADGVRVSYGTKVETLLSFQY
jgi:hypothetical protein